MAFGSWIRKYYDAIKESFGGVLAITTTNFIELNVKRGQQFEVREKFDDIATGDQKYLLLKTGDDPIILKRRVLTTNTDEITFSISKTATLTSNGNPLDVRNYNEVFANTPQTQVFVDPTFSGSGTFRIQDYIPGGDGIGGRASGSFSQSGFERILAANSDYLLEISNNSTNKALNFYIELSWYEGPIKPLGPDEILVP